MTDFSPTLKDQWRGRTNQAVQQFAASTCSRTESELHGFIVTMLEQIGEALDLDCCTIVDLPTAAHAASHSYEWRALISSSTPTPFESHERRSLGQYLARAPRPVVVRHADERPEESLSADFKRYFEETGLETALVIPLSLSRRPTGMWVMGVLSEDHVWSDSAIEHLQMLGDIVVATLDRHRRELRPVEGEGPSRIHAGGRSTPVTAAAHRAAARANPHADDIVGESAAFRAALSMLDEVVNTDSSVLLLGETGTGKELFARALHRRGPRRGFPLVSVNCAALPEALIESELFGHQRGAFTGAIAQRQGRFELANRGTLFLDEVGDLPMELQSKLLRVLQEGTFERIGSSETQRVDVRIVAATHRQLSRAVVEEQFRADLYYRLNVFPIRLPPLRERREDIPALVWSIIHKRQPLLKRHVKTVAPGVMNALQQYSWPGNIRELQNVIERALIHSTGDTLTLVERQLESAGVVVPSDTTSLKEVERAHIEGVLQSCQGRINGLGNAAEQLGLHPNTLRFRMKKLGIVRRASGMEKTYGGPGRARVG